MAVNQNIEVYIDKLVLSGFSTYQRHDIAAAVEAELTRLFAEGGIPAALQSGGNIPSINTGSFGMQKDLKSRTLGNKIAGSVYKSFGK